MSFVCKSYVRHIIIKPKLAQPSFIFIFLLDDFPIVLTDGMCSLGDWEGFWNWAKKRKRSCFRFKRFYVYVYTSQILFSLNSHGNNRSEKWIKRFLHLIGYAKAINLNEACFLFQFKKKPHRKYTSIVREKVTEWNIYVWA